MNGKFLCGLLASLLISGCGDSNTPTEKVLKEQFSNQFHGRLILDSIDIEETSVDGNKRIYAADGSLSTGYDLYTTVASLTDYTVVQKSWDKSKDIKFSATLNSLGSKDTGWQTRFSSLQMSETPKGKPIPNVETDGKYVIMDGAGFDDKIKAVKEKYAKKKTRLDELNNDIVKVETNILAINKEIDEYWGKDENGKILERYTVQRNLNKELDEYHKSNSPYVFERKYDNEIYEPALKARREESNNVEDIRVAKREALDKYRTEYSTEYNKIDEKIKAKMKALDDGLQKLVVKKRGFLQQQSTISDEIRNLDYQYQNWLNFMEELKRRK
ncbi:DUF1202 family protein [Salmonella enterica subsp. enterica]|nr:DUF1202 family protein [Salmonella enterica subsp. enterica serovar Baguida]